MEYIVAHPRFLILVNRHQEVYHAQTETRIAKSD